MWHSWTERRYRSDDDLGIDSCGLAAKAAFPLYT